MTYLVQNPLRDSKPRVSYLCVRNNFTSSLFSPIVCFPLIPNSHPMPK